MKLRKFVSNKRIMEIFVIGLVWKVKNRFCWIGWIFIFLFFIMINFIIFLRRIFGFVIVVLRMRVIVWNYNFCELSLFFIGFCIKWWGFYSGFWGCCFFWIWDIFFSNRYYGWVFIIRIFWENMLKFLGVGYGY